MKHGRPEVAVAQVAVGTATDEGLAQRPVHPAANEASAAASPARRAPAPETVRLYKTDWRAFEAWCAALGFASVPANPATVVAFLTEAAATHGAGALARRAAAIAAQHRQSGIASPADDPAVRTLLSTARRSATRRRALPPKPPALLRMAAVCPGDRSGLRDRTLLLLAAAGLGRAALVGLDAEDVVVTPTGVDLLVQQPDAVRRVSIPRGANRSLCPVEALQDWLDSSDTLFGPVFRKIDRWGNIEQTRLGTDAIRRILARRSVRKLRHGAAAA